MNTIPNFILEQSLVNKKSNFIWRKLRQIWVNSYEDSSINYTLYEKSISIPFSHQLPVYLKQYKYYDSLLTRVGNYLRKIDAKIIMIDIGANIGDSILATYPENTDSYLAIEPSEKFFSYLSENLKSYPSIILINKFISESSNDTNHYHLIEKNGTASSQGTLSKDNISNAITIDNLVNEYEEFKKINFLKVDTDGFDIECINSAKNLINGALPLILFECDDFKQKDYNNKIKLLFEFFQTTGYSNFILYDNFGVMMTIMEFNERDLTHFQNLLNYKSKSNFYYFDILIVPPKYKDILVQEYVHFT